MYLCKKKTFYTEKSATRDLLLELPWNLTSYDVAIIFLERYCIRDSPIHNSYAKTQPILKNECYSSLLILKLIFRNDLSGRDGCWPRKRDGKEGDC